MSQTIGDSKNQPTKEERKNNIHLNGAQIILTERDLEVPPQGYRKSLTVVDALEGPTLTIKAHDGVLREDGKLVSERKNEEGNIVKVLVATFPTSDFKHLKNNIKSRTKKSTREQEVR